MQSFLFSTKVQIPPLPRHGIHRVRLLAALDDAIPHYRLLLLSAPAGYGKTTLLAQWAHQSPIRVAWVSLDTEDNDPDRFFRYLLAAWEEVQPGVRDSRLGVLLGGITPDREAVLAAFINEAARVSKNHKDSQENKANGDSNHLAFVLDDYHLIENPAIHEALAFLLDHLPDRLHLVLAGRGEPPLPLARYRARNQVMEFDAKDLSFSLAESASFLNDELGLGLSDAQVARLQTQLEGWAAGLQLAALGLRRRGAEGDLAADRLQLDGRHRFIADYLREEVLARLPDELRQFLRQTSILESLCGPLCDAVTGTDRGQETLELLEREGLFLVALDDRREWFRYHRLFGDFLREELARQGPEHVAEAHRRAARWHFDRQLPEQAFQHALAGEDIELVVQLFERYANALLHAGEYNLLKQWIDALPAEWYSMYPALDLARAGYLAYTGSFEACFRCVEEVEQRLTPVETDLERWQLARVVAVRCYMACMQNNIEQAESFANWALRELPDEDLGFRPLVFSALGDTYRQNGRWEEARACYLKALEFTQSPTIRVIAVHILGALADLDLRQGRLRSAAAHWRKALASIRQRENWGRLRLPVAGWVYIRMGELLYEWGELAEAEAHLTRGLEHAELGGDVRALIAGYVLMARLRLTEGDLAAAEECLERARPLVEEAWFPDWMSRYERCRLELWLAQGRLRAAVDWANEMLDDPAFNQRAESETAHLAVGRALIAKGDVPSIERALALLGQLLQAAEAEGRTGIAIEALALQAIAHGRRGEQADAMTALERALRLAEPEGYLRVFVDLGAPMARLLHEMRSRAVSSEYVEGLLKAFRAGLLPAAAEEQPLAEPLSAREMEVLELMAAGLTNREIAEKLVVSAETVKKHTGNIYGKLAVRNRREAVNRARELALIT